MVRMEAQFSAAKLEWIMKPMTNKEYVIRAAKALAIDVIGPTKGCSGIIAMAWIAGFGNLVVDAKNWAQARDQIKAYAHKRAA